MKEPDFISSILEHIPELDVKYAIEAMGGSESLYEITLMRTARQIPSNIREMDSSLHANSDLETFAVKTHGIKSVLRHVGEMKLADKSEALEMAAKTGDRIYCYGNYEAFKEELLRFYDNVNVAAGQAAGSETDTEPEVANDGNISDFIDALKQAGEAADSCDSMSAYEIILPLTKIRFGGNNDDLILKAATALDQFRPFEALEYIEKLLNKCENPQIQ